MIQRSYNHYKRIVSTLSKLVDTMKLVIWILSICMVFSTTVNIYFGNTIRWLKEPYSTMIIQNATQEKVIEELVDLKHTMQMEFLYYRIQKSVQDTINQNIEQEYEFLKHASPEAILEYYDKNEQTLGGKDDTIHQY